MAGNSVVRVCLTARDRMIAALLGILFLVAEYRWGVNGIDPSQWNEIAIAAGLRPPQAIFPGVWRMLTGCLFSVFGFDASVLLMKGLGAVTGAGSVALVYLLVRQAFCWLSRIDLKGVVWTRALCLFFSSVAAVLFGVSTPLWDISQTFSSDGLRLLLFLLSTHLWLRWFSCAGEWRLFSVIAIVGLLMAESPFAFLLPAFFLTWYFWLWRDVEDGSRSVPSHLPEPCELPFWRMFFLFVGVMGLVVWANITSFTSLGGLAANGWSSTDVYFRYGSGYLLMFFHSSTAVGWALGLGFGVFPIVVAMRLFPALTREDRLMPFHLGIVLLFVGCVAALQTGLFPAARFWMFSKETVVVGSRALLALYSLASAVTVALAGACFALECHRIFLLDDESFFGRLLRLVPPVLTLVVVCAAVVQVVRPVAHKAQRVVDDALAEIVEECGNAKWLFTDGRLDAGIELTARAVGKTLHPLNMMSGATEWERSLRTRPFPPGTDRDAAAMGIPVLLRVWANEKENGMDDAAMQLGFEFWKRAQKPLPKASGMVAREKGMDDAAAQRGIEAARKLSERVLGLGDAVSRATVSPALASAFSAVSWRLSRFARLRDEEKLADELDASNGVVKKMLSIVEYERHRTFMQMTPSEGLEIALKRADFVEARRYATAVLRVNAKSPEANFGMAMSFLQDGKRDDAEVYFRRVLEVRPDEPAALNNLSIICRKKGCYDEAIAHAKHALKMLPNSKEVKRTLADAEARKP